MLHWANRLASEGAGKGLVLLSASQRPQKVHNDYLTSHETLIACRVIHKADRDALKDWVDGCGDPAIGKEMMAKLADLPRAEAYVWSPEIKFGPKRIVWPLFRTYDSFKPQPVGGGTLKGWASVHLDDVKAKLAMAVEEAKVNDPRALQAEVRRLTAELAKANSTKRQADTASVNKASGDAEKIYTAQIERAVNTAKEEGRQIGFTEGWSDCWPKAWTAGAAAMRAVVRDLSAPDPIAPPIPPRAPRTNGDTKYAPNYASSSTSPAPRLQPQTRPVARPAAAPTGERLPPGETAVLIAAAQFGGVEREQLTILTGYKRSSRDAYIQRLREKGFVSVSGSTISVTDAGASALPADYEPLPTGAALQNYWLARLPKGERKVLQVLIDAYPKSVERSDIDAATGHQRSSRDAYLQRMKAKRLWEKDGSAVRASEVLF